MALIQLAQQYAHYNAWANTKLIVYIQKLDPQHWYANVPSSFNSLDFTLQHLLRTEKFWSLFIAQQPTADFDWSVKTQQCEKIQEELLAQSNQFAKFVDQYTEQDVLEILELNTAWAKNKRARWEYILHVVNHSTFHRGQLITMLRYLGFSENIPATDYNMFRCE